MARRIIPQGTLALAVTGLACHALWLPAAAATPVEDEIGAREPTEVPQFTSALLALYFDTLSAYSRDARAQSEMSYDEPTTLHAIALSRASGVPFSAQEVADAKLARTRTSQAVQVVIPQVDDVFSALLLGVPRISGSVVDLPYAIVNDLGETVERTHRLGEEDTLSGLAVLANGIQLDPHLLMDQVEVSRKAAASGTATLGSIPGAGAAITRESVLAASTLFRLGQPFPGSLIANLELGHSDEIVAMRDVALPEQRALAAIALARQGASVAAEDILDVHEISTARIEESRAVAFALEDVLLVLMLGFEPYP